MTPVEEPEATTTLPPTAPAAPAKTLTLPPATPADAPTRTSMLPAAADELLPVATVTLPLAEPPRPDESDREPELPERLGMFAVATETPPDEEAAAPRPDVTSTAPPELLLDAPPAICTLAPTPSPAPAMMETLPARADEERALPEAIVTVPELRGPLLPEPTLTAPDAPDLDAPDWTATLPLAPPLPSPVESSSSPPESAASDVDPVVMLMAAPAQPWPELPADTVTMPALP